MSIEADYRFPPGVDAAALGKKLALGQTAGTWDARYDHLAEQFKQHLGEVAAVAVEESGTQRVTIRYPEANVEGDVGTLLAMVWGKYSMAFDAKLMALRVPESYGTKAKFGVAGIRRLLNVPTRPLVMGIFKPALGLSAEGYEAIARDAAAGGIDVLIDDEIMPNLPSAPTLDRLKAVNAVLKQSEEKTGKRTLYAVNCSGKGGSLINVARELVEAGATALLFNPLCYGHSMLEALSADPEISVPIFVHPAYAGALARAPMHGVAYSVLLGTLNAIAGADVVLFPCKFGNMSLGDAEDAAIIKTLRAYGIMPAPSAGVHAGLIPQLYQAYGNDIIINAGTAIMDHEAGVQAGVEAFLKQVNAYE